MIVLLGTLLTSLGTPQAGSTRILFGVSLLGLGAFTVLTIVKARNLTESRRESGAIDVLFLAIGLGMFAICATAVAITWPEERLDIKSIRSLEAGYQYVAYKRMGELIGKNHPGGKLLVIKYGYNKYYDRPNQIEVAIDKGLKDGLAGKVEIVSTELVTETEDPKTGELLWNFTAGDFDTIVDRNPECDVIFSMVGLPNSLDDTAYWRDRTSTSKPHLYLTNFWTDKPMSELFKNGHVKGALMDRPVPVDITLPVPKNAEEAFDRRFALLTPENPALPQAASAPVPDEPSIGYVTLSIVAWVLRSPILVIGLFYIAIAIYALRRIRKNRRENADLMS